MHQYICLLMRVTLERDIVGIIENPEIPAFYYSVLRLVVVVYTVHRRR